MPPPIRRWTRPRANPNWRAPSMRSRPACWRRKPRQLGAWLVHYSHRLCVRRQRRRSRGWKPTRPAPLSVYGATKLEGEQLIRAIRLPAPDLPHQLGLCARAAATSPRPCCGWPRERDSLNVIDDQIGAPTGADLLADVTAHAIRTARAAPEVSGLYHLVAGGETSWHGYASFVIDFARRGGHSTQGRARCDQAGAHQRLPDTRQAPAQFAHGHDKLRRTFDLHLPDWQTGVERMLSEVLEKSM